MRTVILCLESFVENARVIGGAQAEVVVTTGKNDYVSCGSDRIDLLMVFLHPSLDGLAWLDDQARTVLTTEEVNRLPLEGATVFLGVCFGLEHQAMIEALWQAGAAVVIAGADENVGGAEGRPSTLDRMAGTLRAALEVGLPVQVAWLMAQGVARMAVWRAAIVEAAVAGVGLEAARSAYEAAKDAAGFKLLTRPATAGRQAGRQTTGGQSQYSPAGKMAGRAAGCAAIVLFVLGVIGSGGTLLTTTFTSPPSPLATPTTTATAVATLTPWYTPHPWSLNMFPTATPCITGPGCVPQDTVDYELFYPAAGRYFREMPYIGAWNKLVYVNGVLTSTGATLEVKAGDVVSVVNQAAIANNGNVSFTLVDEWVTSTISVTGWASTTGSIVNVGGTLTWTVSNQAAWDYHWMTATWLVISDSWTTGDLTETLNLEGDGYQQKLVEFEDNPFIESWTKQVWVNGVITGVGGTTITVQTGDAITVADTITVGGNAPVGWSLVDVWATSQLSSTGWVSTTGTAVKTSGRLTWTVSGASGYVGQTITKTWEVVSGTWTMGIMTKSLQVVGDGSEQRYVRMTK